MITIVDYNTGNLKSIVNMLGHLGIPATISREQDTILQASKLILPGVGTFDYGMSMLRKLDLVDVLEQKVLHEETPVLGICLGAQLLTYRSEEGVESGLGWINAETRRFRLPREDHHLRIPHMGWAETEYRKSSRIFNNAVSTPRFYYVHSYHLVCSHEQNELCHAIHGYRFATGIEHKNIVGVQFHPEKSHRFGMQVLKNFAELY